MIVIIVIIIIIIKFDISFGLPIILIEIFVNIYQCIS